MKFFSLLYNCSLKGYRLLRDSKNIILPSYSIIKSLTSTYMNPLIEQHDNNFLKYSKNRFKLQVQKDTTVSLLVYEIHLKPSSSSSCCAASMDLPDPLLPPISIVHCSQWVFKATSCIGRELLYIGSSWSS